MSFIFLLQAKYRLTNQVVSLILKIFKDFLEVLGTFSAFCCNLAKEVPPTMYRAMKALKRDVDFRRYVACKRCHTIYSFKDCINFGSTSSCRISKCCSNRPFNRQECGTLLLKSVQMSTGTKLLYPFLTYCFLGMKTPLQSLLLRQGFVENCNEWKTRDVSENVLMDVYDGKMWKEF